MCAELDSIQNDESSGTGHHWTLTVTTVEWTIVPLVPVMVNLEVLVPAVEVACTVSVVEPEPVTDAGLKLAVTLGPGNPATVKFTAPTKLPEGETVMVE